jgi:anti-sigma B factor antagonist
MSLFVYPRLTFRYHSHRESLRVPFKREGSLWGSTDLQETSMFDREQIVPEPTNFSADVVHLDGNAVIALVGELDMASAPDLSSVLEPLVVDGPSELVLDLSGLSFLDSSGLALLALAQQRLCVQGRSLRIRSPQRGALRVFEISGLTEILNVDLSAESR